MNEWDQIQNTLQHHLLERRQAYQKLKNHRLRYTNHIIYCNRKILNILFYYPMLLGNVKQMCSKKNKEDRIFLTNLQKMIRTSKRRMKYNPNAVHVKKKKKKTRADMKKTG